MNDIFLRFETYQAIAWAMAASLFLTMFLGTVRWIVKQAIPRRKKLYNGNGPVRP